MEGGRKQDRRRGRERRKVHGRLEKKQQWKKDI